MDNRASTHVVRMAKTIIRRSVQFIFVLCALINIVPEIPCLEIDLHSEFFSSLQLVYRYLKEVVLFFNPVKVN